MVQCIGSGSPQWQWRRIFEFWTSTVSGSTWNYSSNYLSQYTSAEWGGWEKKPPLVGGCLCFIDRSPYVIILLGRSTYLYSIFDQPGTLHTINFQTPSQALAEAIVSPAVPNLSPHIFGCVAFVHLHKHQRNKLSPRALRRVFLRYAAYQKGYQCYHPPT